MQANRVMTELETIVHRVLVMNDGALKLSLVVIFVVFDVGAAWMTPTRQRKTQKSRKHMIVSHDMHSVRYLYFTGECQHNDSRLKMV
jgi:hypothetical protein